MSRGTDTYIALAMHLAVTTPDTRTTLVVTKAVIATRSRCILSTVVQTPRAPPLPVAALLSPILWRLNRPDKFDMYSVGVLFLQLTFANLRT